MRVRMDSGLIHQDLIKDNKVPNTGGLPSFNNLQSEGYNVIVF